uniref:Uncharacterized protein n=1 Tax=Cyclopterus lumpus TaxID=8103 RepID=A0A8C2WXY7_CYCLU
SVSHNKKLCLLFIIHYSSTSLAPNCRDVEERERRDNSSFHHNVFRIFVPIFLPKQLHLTLMSLYVTLNVIV